VLVGWSISGKREAKADNIISITVSSIEDADLIAIYSPINNPAIKCVEPVIVYVSFYNEKPSR
jgi:hypothetical protein